MGRGHILVAALPARWNLGCAPIRYAFRCLPPMQLSLVLTSEFRQLISGPGQIGVHFAQPFLRPPEQSGLNDRYEDHEHETNHEEWLLAPDLRDRLLNPLKRAVPKVRQGHDPAPLSPWRASWALQVKIFRIGLAKSMGRMPRPLCNAP